MKNTAPDSWRYHRFICHWKGSDKQNEFPDTHRRTHEFIQGLKITSPSVKNQSSSTYRASPGYLAHPPHVRNNKISNLHTPIEKQISRKHVTCMYIKSFLEALVLFDPSSNQSLPPNKKRTRHDLAVTAAKSDPSVFECFLPYHAYAEQVLEPRKTGKHRKTVLGDESATTLSLPLSNNTALIQIFLVVSVSRTPKP